MDRGLIDAAEFNNPTSDKALGFPDVSKVYMMQSFHQSAEALEILFNKKKYDALPDKLKSIIANAVEAASADMSWKAIDRYSQDYIEIQAKDKVKVYKTPNSVLLAQLKAWDDIIAKKSADNPWFKKVIDSQRAFAQRATKWQNDQQVDFKIAANHYFAQKT
jgi:TRAP-type mannitol/chloroaromatic compound transport system substrate-binding protein